MDQVWMVLKIKDLLNHNLVEMIHVIPSRRVNGFISIGRTCGENKKVFRIRLVWGKPAWTQKLLE